MFAQTPVDRCKLLTAWLSGQNYFIHDKNSRFRLINSNWSKQTCVLLPLSVQFIIAPERCTKTRETCDCCQQVSCVHCHTKVSLRDACCYIFSNLASAIAPDKSKTRWFIAVSATVWRDVVCCHTSHFRPINCNLFRLKQQTIQLKQVIILYSDLNLCEYELIYCGINWRSWNILSETRIRIFSVRHERLTQHDVSQPSQTRA